MAERGSKKNAGRVRGSTSVRNPSTSKVAGSTRKTGPVSQRISGNSSRRVAGSTYGASSALNAGGAGGLRRVEYETINGVKLDMTPQSLLMPVRSAQPPSRAPKGAAGAESGSNQAEIMGKGGGQPGVDHAKEALASGRESKSGTATGEGGFRKQSSGGMGKKKSDLKHDHGKSRAQMRAHNQALGRMGSHASAGAGAADEARQLAEQEKYEAFMKATIEICLEETETETILHVPGDAIPNDYKDFEAIKARNAAYGRLVEGKKGSDNYAGRRAQTLNPGRKDKEAAADPPAQRDAEAMASAFDIFDAMQREEEADDPDEEHAHPPQGQQQQQQRPPAPGEGEGGQGAGGKGGAGKGGGGKAAAAGAAGAGAGAGARESELSRRAREVAAVTLSRPGCLLDADAPVVPPPPREIVQRQERQNRLYGGGGGGGGNPGESGFLNAGASASFGRSTNNARASAQNAGSRQNYQQQQAAAPPIDPSEEEQVNPKEVLAQQEAAALLASHRLAASLRLAERAVQQNLWHPAHVAYRDYPEEEEGPAGGGASDAEGDPEAGPGGGGGGGGPGGALGHNLSRPTLMGLTAGGNSTLGGGGRAAPSVKSGRSARDHASSRGDLSLAGRTAGANGDASRIDEGEDEDDEEGSASRAAGGEGGEGDSLEGEGGGPGGEGGGAPLHHHDGPAPRLERLFAFQLAEEGVCRTVTAMSWNKVNQDVLAAAYGTFHYAPGLGGRVHFWSLRNPEHPERSLRLESPATTLDFSASRPNLLAVGTYDGAVAVYDTARGPEDGEDGDPGAPVRQSGDSDGKHTDPVWQVRWLDKGPERGETLVSISTDGRVVEWATKKGLAHTTLMALKSVGNTEGVISRQASGMCLDFPLNDINAYFAGTEDGIIHKCSPSYNEQSLETFAGHTGPVYRLRCSPFWQQAFLSCSADWTVKLWCQKQTEPMYSFLSTDLSDEVLDITWSPSNSTLFASVTGDGRIELWDLKQSQLDPILRKFKKKPVIEHNSRPHTSADSTGDSEGGSEAGGGPSRPPTRPATTRPPPPPAGQPSRPPTRGAGAGLNGGAGGRPGTAAAAAAASAAAAQGGGLPGGVGDGHLQLTAVLFAINAPILVVGDSEGCIDVFRVHNVDTHPQARFENQVEELQRAIYPDGLPSDKIRRNS